MICSNCGVPMDETPSDLYSHPLRLCTTCTTAYVWGYLMAQQRRPDAPAATGDAPGRELASLDDIRDQYARGDLELACAWTIAVDIVITRAPEADEQHRSGANRLMLYVKNELGEYIDLDDGSPLTFQGPSLSLEQIAAAFGLAPDAALWEVNQA